MNFDILTHIDIIAVALVIMGGIFSSKYAKGWSINNATKTLIFGSLFISIYLLILQMSGQLFREDWSKYFISYCVATSLYEIFKKVIVDGVKKATGKDIDKIDTDYPNKP